MCGVCVLCSIIHYSLYTENSNDCSSHKDGGEMCEFVCVCPEFICACLCCTCLCAWDWERGGRNCIKCSIISVLFTPKPPSNNCSSHRDCISPGDPEPGLQKRRDQYPVFCSCPLSRESDVMCDVREWQCWWPRIHPRRDRTSSPQRNVVKCVRNVPGSVPEETELCPVVYSCASCHREFDAVCERRPRISPQKRQSYVQCTIVVLDPHREYDEMCERISPKRDRVNYSVFDSSQGVWCISPKRDSVDFICFYPHRECDEMCKRWPRISPKRDWVDYSVFLPPQGAWWDVWEGGCPDSPEPVTVAAGRGIVSAGQAKHRTGGAGSAGADWGGIKTLCQPVVGKFGSLF